MTYFPKQCVVVPIDFSAESLAAVSVGRSLVDSPQHLHVIHILIDIAPLEAGEVWGVIDPQARIEQVEKLLRGAPGRGGPRHRQLRPGETRRVNCDPIPRPHRNYAAVDRLRC